MVKLKTFQNRSSSWKCWQGFTQRRARGRTITWRQLSLSTTALQHRRELSGQCLWPANSHDLTCLSPVDSVALWPSETIFLSCVFVFQLKYASKGKRLPFQPPFTDILSSLNAVWQTGLLTTTRKRAKPTAGESQWTQKHQVFSDVYSYFPSTYVNTHHTWVRWGLQPEHFQGLKTLTFPSNGLEQFTHLLIMTDKVVPSIMLRGKYIH